MKKNSYIKLFAALTLVMLMSMAGNMVFGIGLVPCALTLAAGSVLISFLPAENFSLLTSIVPSIFEIKTYGYGARRIQKTESRRFKSVGKFGSACYLTDAEEKAVKDKKEKEDAEKVEIKTAGDLLKHLNETKAALETSVKNEVKAEVKELTEGKLAEIDKKIAEVKGLPEGVTPEELKQALEDLKITMKSFDRFQINFKKNGSQKTEVKSFNDVLSETIRENAEKIKNFKKGNPEEKFEMKAVGDMSIAVNFPTAGTFNVDIRNQLIESPYNRVWLSDVLPQGTSNGSSILYPKENGGEGGAALWTDKTQNKAQMDFDLTGQNAYFKWLAGFVIIEREMLDDIAFLESYLRNKMLISLKIAENNFILNGSADANPVQGMIAAATAYDGTYAADVDRIIDAAWGQLVEETFDFYNPTHTILTPRDSVHIGLNKALGSGEYDLPEGSVAFSQGKLGIAGLQTVKTTQIVTGNFLVFDKNAIMFIKRMQPELRLFESAELAKLNKLMFRVEERATLAIFNNNALVKGTLSTES
jgi:hypothetical protein